MRAIDREETYETIRIALNEWDIDPTVFYPTSDEEGSARFVMWRLSFDMPLYVYDGEVWVGSDDGYHSPLTTESVWTWIASDLARMLNQKGV